MLGSSFLFGKEPEGCRQIAIGAHGSAARADCLPRGKPFGAPAGAGLLPVGSDAPTAARTMGLPPRRGIVLSFDAKESTKESMRHGDSGKKAPIAHFDGGARNVARNEAGQLSQTGGARSCSPFSAVKMGGPFSLRCLSPLCPGTVGVGIYSIPAGWDVTVRPDFFARQKASGKSNPRWPFQRAMRPIAEWRSGLANKQEVVPDRRAARPSAERR